jgi:hypothetical protein
VKTLQGFSWDELIESIRNAGCFLTHLHPQDARKQAEKRNRCTGEVVTQGHTGVGVGGMLSSDQCVHLGGIPTDTVEGPSSKECKVTPKRIIHKEQ